MGFHGRRIALESLKLSLVPIRELVMTQLILFSSVPRVILDKLLGPFPIGEPRLEIRLVDVRLGEFGTVRGKLRYLPICHLLAHQLLCLLLGWRRCSCL